MMSIPIDFQRFGSVQRSWVHQATGDPTNDIEIAFCLAFTHRISHNPTVAAKLDLPRLLLTH